jgi:uncharacterized membrane protein YfcA
MLARAAIFGLSTLVIGVFLSKMIWHNISNDTLGATIILALIAKALVSYWSKRHLSKAK